MNWFKKLLGIHAHDFRHPINHKGRYWMKCTHEGCDWVRDIYLKMHHKNPQGKIERLEDERN